MYRFMRALLQTSRKYTKNRVLRIFSRPFSVAIVAPTKIIDVTPNDPELITRLRDLESEEGWNPGKFDIEYYLRSQQVRLFALLASNSPVAYMSVFNSNNFSFLGSLICARQERGKRYGEMLWKHGLSFATGTVGLYASPSMVHYYQKSGFVVMEPIRRITFKPKLTAHTPPENRDTDVERDIPKFDFEATGIDRRSLLKVMIDDKANTIVSSSAPNGFCTGYALLRELSDGCWRLSFSGTDKIAMILALQRVINAYLLNHAIPKESPLDQKLLKTIIADVPESRASATGELLREAGFDPTLVPPQDFALPTMFLSAQKSFTSLINPLRNHTGGILSVEVG